MDEVRYFYEPSTLSLIYSLSRHPHLAQLVRKVRFAIDYDEGEGVYTTVPSCFATVVELCTSLDSLTIFNEEDHGNDCREYLFRWLEKPVRAHPTTFNIGWLSGDVWELLEVLQDDVQHLSFGYLGYAFDAAAVLAAGVILPLDRMRLQSLVYRYGGSDSAQTFSPLVASSHHTLTRLTVPTNVVSDLSDFTALRHLTLWISNDTTVAELVTFVASMPPLLCLELRGAFRTEVDSSQFPALARALPTSLLKLDLPPFLSHSDILAIVQHLPPVLVANLRFLGTTEIGGIHRPDCLDRSVPAEVRVLWDECEKRGIRLTVEGNGWPVRPALLFLSYETF